jgi:hypothetical protein
LSIPSVVPGGTIRFSITYRDGEQRLVDPDGYVSMDTTAEPHAILYDPNEQLILTIEADNVSRMSTGIFYYDYYVATNSTIGTYRVRWSAHVSDVPIVYDDYFKVTATPSAISYTLIDRIKRELKTLADLFEDDEYADIQLDAEADVMSVSTYGLAWHNAWEIMWLTKRGVRHALQRIVNDWLTKFSITKAGKSLSLSDPSRAIMQRIDQIDQAWAKAKEDHWFDGVHWLYRPTDSATTSYQQVMAYDVDMFTGLDRTPYYDEDGVLRPAYYDEDPWEQEY